MNALTLIQTLMFTRASDTKLKTATNVLDELYDIKKNKKLPFLTIRRAIKMQERLINDLKS
jgi:hypothetical protein